MWGSPGLMARSPVHAGLRPGGVRDGGRDVLPGVLLSSAMFYLWTPLVERRFPWSHLVPVPMFSVFYQDPNLLQGILLML